MLKGLVIILIDRILNFLAGLLGKLWKDQQDKKKLEEKKKQVHEKAEAHEKLTGVENQSPEDIEKRRKAFEDAINSAH